MSQENVDLAYRAYAALQADDFERFLSYVDPDAEWRPLVLEIEGIFRGHEGVRKWCDFRAVFPDWQPSIVEARDFGDRVLARARGVGVGAGSGAGVDDEFWQVAEFRQGRIVRYWAFRTEQEALAVAAGAD